MVQPSVVKKVQIGTPAIFKWATLLRSNVPFNGSNLPSGKRQQKLNKVFDIRDFVVRCQESYEKEHF